MCVHICQCACVLTTKSTLFGTLKGEGARLSAQEVATNVEATEQDDESRYRAKNIISGLLYFESLRNHVIAGPVLYAPINLNEVSGPDSWALFGLHRHYINCHELWAHSKRIQAVSKSDQVGAMSMAHLVLDRKLGWR